MRCIISISFKCFMSCNCEIANFCVLRIVGQSKLSSLRQTPLFSHRGTIRAKDNDLESWNKRSCMVLLIIELFPFIFIHVHILPNDGHTHPSLYCLQKVKEVINDNHMVQGLCINLFKPSTKYKSKILEFHD